MEDTTREIKRKFYELLMSRTEEERFLMCVEMFDSAREIALSAMPRDLCEAEQKQYVYRKIYGENLPVDFFFR